MKKKIFLLALLFAVNGVTVSFAQNDGVQNKMVVDKTEMVKRRTDNMVKRYGLNSKQAEQLLKLNTEYEGKMGMRFMPFRGMNGRAGLAVRMQPGRVEPDSLMRKPLDSAKRKGGKKKMETARSEYETKLKDIMTSEQFQKYQKDGQLRLGRATLKPVVRTDAIKNSAVKQVAAPVLEEVKKAE